MYPDYLIDTKFFQLDLYGLLMFTGIIAALIVFDVYTTRRGMPAASQRFFIVAIIVSIVAGIGAAILCQSLYDYIATGRWSWNSGMTFLGGLIGGAATFLIIFAIVNKIKKGKYTKDLGMVLEVLACSVTIAHFFGRLGCFTAGCCYGRETSSVFGLHFPYLSGFTEPNPPEYRVHPTQLYEAFALLVLFLLSTWLFFKRPRFTLPTYLSGYGLARFVIEFYRGDNRGELIGSTLYPSQWISLVMMAVGVVWLIVYVIGEIRSRGKTPPRERFVVEPYGEDGWKKYSFLGERASCAVTDCDGALISYCVDGAECLSGGGRIGLAGLPYAQESAGPARWHVRGKTDGLILTRAFQIPAETKGRLSAIVALTLTDDAALILECRVRTDTDTMCGLFPSFAVSGDLRESGDGRWTATTPGGELNVETAVSDLYAERDGDRAVLSSRRVEELRQGEEYACLVTLRFTPNPPARAVSDEAEEGGGAQSAPDASC